MTKSKQTIKAFFFLKLIIAIIFNCLLSINSIAQRTTVEKGPFQPYNGRREMTFNKDNFPIELKEYDDKGNLRRHRTQSQDLKRRVIESSRSDFDDKNNLIAGSKISIVYKDSLDVMGKVTYKKYDSKIRDFLVVTPLVSGYEQTMISKPLESLQLDSFYKKYADASGIPIVSSEKTPDAAILMARDIVNYILMKRPDVREELINRKSRVLVMAESEMETDLPERRDWQKPSKDDIRLTPYERENYDKPGGIGSMTDREYWNQRARGMGGNEVSCAEENLLGYAGTRYYGENILVHEFSHNIMNALENVDSVLYLEILKAYEGAKSKGLYKNQYAINTVAEYWAEGSQWWFWSNIEFYDGQMRIQSPEDLKAYDPTLYHIFERVYPGHHIPADVYYGLNLSPIR